MSMLKTIGIFSVGFAAGAFFMKKYMDKNLVEPLQEEIEAIEEYYKGSELKKTVDKAYDAVKDVADKAGTAIKKFRSTINKENYSGMFLGSDSDFVDESTDSEKTYPRDDTPDPEPPYIISQDEETPIAFSRVVLTYYINSDILTEDEEIIDNPDYIVGREFKNLINEDTDSVLVRNEKLSTDFEIIFDYSDKETVREILGYEEIND